MAELTADDIREAVRERYAAIATAGSSCCGEAQVLSLGCGVPTAVADLHDARPTHRVHEHASAAIIRARKPWVTG
jgi:hypothetical protein